jgi:hypothetical protein
MAVIEIPHEFVKPGHRPDPPTEKLSRFMRHISSHLLAPLR